MTTEYYLYNERREKVIKVESAEYHDINYLYGVEGTQYSHVKQPIKRLDMYQFMKDNHLMREEELGQIDIFEI